VLPLIGHGFTLSQEGRISEAINSTRIVALFLHIILTWSIELNIHQQLLIARKYFSGKRHEGLLCWQRGDLSLRSVTDLLYFLLYLYFWLI